MTTLEDELRVALRTQAQALPVPERPALDREVVKHHRLTGRRWLIAAATGACARYSAMSWARSLELFTVNSSNCPAQDRLSGHPIATGSPAYQVFNQCLTRSGRRGPLTSSLL